MGVAPADPCPSNGDHLQDAEASGKRKPDQSLMADKQPKVSWWAHCASGGGAGGGGTGATACALYQVVCNSCCWLQAATLCAAHH